MTVQRSKVVVKRGKTEEADDFPNEGHFEGDGVKEEVIAWADCISHGKSDGRFEPEEGLKDLEILEMILRSGEHDGNPIDLMLQSS